MDPTDVLPSGGRLIHLGPPKTGTSAIQAALHASRAPLAEHGVHVLPADRPRDRQAGLALFGGTRPGSGFSPDLQWWNRFAGEVAETGGTQVISNEAFAKAGPDGVARLVGDIGSEDARYLYVVRRLDRLLLSHWQESVKGGSPRDDITRWTATVLGDRDGPTGQNFWVANDVDSVIRRFLAHVDPTAVTLLIADEGDREQLPRFFERVLGVPAGTLQAPQDGRANRSLSLNEVEVIRHLNVIGEERGWSEEDRRFLLKRGLVRHLEAQARRPGDLPLRMPRSQQAAIEEQTVRRADAISALAAEGVRVVGDPATLVPPAADYADDVPGGDDLVVSLPAAVDLVAATVEAARRRAVDEPQMKARMQTPGTRERPARSLLTRLLRR